MANHQFKQKKEDEYYTKEYAVSPILKYISKENVVWCPFDTKDSNFYKVFKRNNYTVKTSHIAEGKDFFGFEPSKYDVIVSNPPYSRREDVIIRLFELKKPFAILINDAGLFDSIKRYNALSNNKFEIMVFNKRIDYIKPDNPNMKGVPFKSIYLCSKMLPNQITFEVLGE